jgi:hypothetical protein
VQGQLDDEIAAAMAGGQHRHGAATPAGN